MSNNTKFKNRLTELRAQKNITRKDFAAKYSVTDSTMKSYENGNRSIPIELASKIANDFNITLDWIFCRNSFLDDKDIMVDIVFALGKVFKIIMKRHINNQNGVRYEHKEMTLLVDPRFHDYLSDIRELEYIKSTSNVITDTNYRNMREEIYLKHKDYIRSIFESESFNKEKAILLESIEDSTILNLF